MTQNHFCESQEQIRIWRAIERAMAMAVTHRVLHPLHARTPFSPVLRTVLLCAPPCKHSAVDTFLTSIMRGYLLPLVACAGLLLRTACGQSNSATPLPAPGTITPIVFGASLSAIVPLGDNLWYSFTIPAGAAPNGFSIVLTPITPDPDLFVSTTMPTVAGGFVAGVGLTAGAGGLAVDTVSIAPTSAHWLPSGGPYYIQVLGHAGGGGDAAFTLSTVALGSTPSASVLASPTATRSNLPTAIVPPPVAGTLLTLPFGTRTWFVDLPATQSLFYSVVVPATVSGFRVLLQADAGNAAQLYVSPTPPNGATFVYAVPALQSLLGAGQLNTVQVLPASPHYVAAGATYYVEVYAMPGVLNRPTFNLLVEPLPPSPSPSSAGTSSPSPTAVYTAVTPVPLPGSVIALVLNTPFAFRDLPALGSMIFSIAIPAGTPATVGGYVFQLSSAPGGNADLYLRNLPLPAGAVTFPNWVAASTLAGFAATDTITILPASAL